MSGILRKRPPSGGRTAIGPSSSKKQRFTDVVKAFLDIAKESSDVFPPLKSCLGGVTALIKHYEEYSDVKEKLGDLIPWVEKLEAALVKANPSEDTDEVDRRSQLAQDLEDIGKRSQALSEKGKLARALDKKQDSGEVIRLLEKLRQTILIYQVSQQQSIYNQITQLTSSFGAMLKLHQVSPVEKQIAFVRARLDRFKVNGKPSRNADELRRQKSLFEALEGIRDQLEFLAKQVDKDKDKGVDVAAVVDLAEALKDVILDYQFSQQKAIYNQNCTLIDAVESMVLNSCRQAQAAEFRHGDRRGCLKGTREAVLDEIESWSKDYTLSPVYWLNGLAGTGKSTVAQTIAERVFADGRLGASFFCSRDFEDRRDLRYIFPTLAIQLAYSYPEFRSILVPFLRSKPGIVHESLYNQMESLIVGPLSTLNISTVIIIDALDECVDEDPQSAILSVMGRLVEGIPSVKFLITGRPEPRIKSGFRLGLLKPLTDVFVLHEVDPSVVNVDIRLFLEQGLHEIAKRQGVEQGGWPTDEYLDLLCERAGGLFVYAVATLKFLDHSFTPPSEQLDVIIRAPGSTTHEGQAKLPLGATLDSLYLSSFRTAFNRTAGRDDEKVRLVIGAVVLAVNPLPPSAIADLVGLGKQEVMNLLQLVQSLLKLSEDPDSPVLPFHKSFPDFIMDPLRCSDTRFHIPLRTGHLKLALSCLRLMNSSLEQNLLSLPNYALNSEVEDLQGRVDSTISTALRYACRSWHNHLTEVREDIGEVIPTLKSFLQERFLGWLEVLSVIGAGKDAVVALEILILWLQKIVRDHQLLLTARDYFQFVTNFIEVIDTSATHLYHSALELSPLKSTVRKLYYHQRPHPSPKVVFGIADSWKPATAISSKDSCYLSSVWSPCSQFVAVMGEEAVEIWDALTLKPLSTPQSKRITGFRRGLAYSPDGYSLAGCSDSAIVIWDTQTGGEVTRVNCRVPQDGLELVWSKDGKTIATASGWKSETTTVHTYSVSSGKMMFLGTLRSRDKPHVWAHEETFQIIATSQDEKGKTFNIFEVGSTLTRVQSFPFKFHFSLRAFSPTTYRAALSCDFHYLNTTEPCILDICSSEVLLQHKDMSGMAFSPDGSFLAGFIQDNLSIWKYSSDHYTLWKQFKQSLAPSQFSPASLSILGGSSTCLYILHLEHFPVLTTEPKRTIQSKPKDAFSLDGTYIATAYQGESTITLTNLHPQNPFPSQFINTEFEILAMVLTGSVLVVTGSDKIAAWRLTKKGVVDGIIGNTRADQNDSLWEISIPTIDALVTRVHGPSRVDKRSLGFLVVDEIAVIRLHGMNIRSYHIGTGEIVKLAEIPQSGSSKFYRFYNDHSDDCNLYHSNPSTQLEPIEGKWSVSQTTFQEGWMRDTGGKHRLWLPLSWRTIVDVNWLHNATTLRLRNRAGYIIVKF